MVEMITPNIAEVVARRSLPGITIWNRLEGRPRTERFDRALAAEIRDPLWMLTRQWQMGEFIGDDAGSPIDVRVQIATSILDTYRAIHGGPEPLDDRVPLEARVEPRPLPLRLASNRMQLEVRVLAGRQWLKMLAPVLAAAPAAAGQFGARYPIDLPSIDGADDAATRAHVEGWSNVAAVASRRMDGLALFAHLAAPPGNKASDGIAALAGMDAQVDPIAARYVAWFRRVLAQPGTNDAWESERLEYQFAVSTPRIASTKVYVADEYYTGHIGWYSLDLDPTRHTLDDPPPGGPLGGPPAPPAPAVEDVATLSMLPTQATFNGMPNTRWWTFEDSRTSFADIKPDTTDLAKLLLIEFGLVFANDWFIAPFTLDAGRVADVRGLVVTNVFGERIWVDAASRGADDDPNRWGMFQISTAGSDLPQPADLSLVLTPSARTVMDGPPMEDVMIARDEMANMVWAVERGITLPSGVRKNGREAAAETLSFFEGELESRLGAPPQPPPPALGAKVRYNVMTTVPENWIPLVPVHAPGSNRDVRLQRAAMLRILEGEPSGVEPAVIEPRTSLMRPGLDDAVQASYFINEEEIPRSGTQVTLSYRRTRGRDGAVWLWLGVRKRQGRGEGSSGLAFDQILDVPQPS
jgi:hypothetical protein